MKIGKILFGSFVCACLAGAAFLCACDALPDEKAPAEEPPAVHVHTFGEWREIPATCEEDGVRERGCLICDEVQSEPLKALGHAWEEVSKTPATCQKEGALQKECSRCGAVQSEPLKALGHAWEEVSKTPATCQKEGALQKECSRCGAGKTEILPIADHEWQEIDVVKAATCTQDGLRAAVCKTCGKREDEQIIPALGHTFSAWVRESEPTCETDGEERRTCDVCGAEEKNSLPARGHNYDPNLTVDVAPQIGQAGEASHHCLNDGCHSRTGVTVLEPLKDETTYNVVLRNSSGGALPACEPVIAFYDEEGNKVEEQSAQSVSFTLPSKRYFVEVSGVPYGYTVPKERYEVTPELPLAEIRIPAHMIMEAPPLDLKYRVGALMYNMKVQVVGLSPADDCEMTLYDLFSQYKAVLLNMYFCTCGVCVSEMPAFLQAYNTKTSDGSLYGEEVACVMLDAYENVERVRQFKKKTNAFIAGPTVTDLPMIMIHDAWLRAYFMRAMTTSFPTSILIDCEGVIMESHIGGMNASQFTAMMQRGLDRYQAIQTWRESEGLNEEPPESAAQVADYDLAPDFVTVKRRALAFFRGRATDVGRSDL